MPLRRYWWLRKKSGMRTKGVSIGPVVIKMNTRAAERPKRLSADRWPIEKVRILGDFATSAWLAGQHAN